MILRIRHHLFPHAEHRSVCTGRQHFAKKALVSILVSSLPVFCRPSLQRQKKNSTLNLFCQWILSFKNVPAVFSAAVHGMGR